MLMVAGGYDGAVLPNVEVFDGTTGKWRRAEPLTVPRASCAVSPLGTGDDRVLVAGGWGGDDDGGTGGLSIGSLEVYDPAVQRWQLLEGLALRQPRRGLRAALTEWRSPASGAVEPLLLLMGGETDNGDCVRTVEALCPAATHSSENGHASFTATSVSSVGPVGGAEPRGTTAGLEWANPPTARRLRHGGGSSDDSNSDIIRSGSDSTDARDQSDSGGGGAVDGLVEKVSFFQDDDSSAPSPIKAAAEPLPPLQEDGDDDETTVPAAEAAEEAAAAASAAAAAVTVAVPPLALDTLPTRSSSGSSGVSSASSLSTSSSTSDDDDGGSEDSAGRQQRRAGKALQRSSSWGKLQGARCVSSVRLCVCRARTHELNST